MWPPLSPWWFSSSCNFFKKQGHLHTRPRSLALALPSNTWSEFFIRMNHRQKTQSRQVRVASSNSSHCAHCVHSTSLCLHTSVGDCGLLIFNGLSDVIGWKYWVSQHASLVWSYKILILILILILDSSQVIYCLMLWSLSSRSLKMKLRLLKRKHTRIFNTTAPGCRYPKDPLLLNTRQKFRSKTSQRKTRDKRWEEMWRKK